MSDVSTETVVNTLVDILSESTEIQDYCTANFGQQLHFFIGFDPDNAPDDESEKLPAVIIHRCIFDINEERATYDVYFGLVTSKPDVVVNPNNSRIINYEGMLHTCMLSEIIVQKVFEDRGKFKGKATIKTELETNDVFPVFDTELMLSVEYLVKGRI